MQRSLTHWFTRCLAVATILAAAGRAATTVQEVEEDQSLESALVTPHKAWAKPYAGGRLRALFVVNAGSYGGAWFAPGTRMREVVELNQRFDLKSDAIFIGGKGQTEFLGNALGRSRAEKLLGNPYDVYVIAGTSLAKLPPKMQYLLMKEVAQGAGLVCCGPGSKDFLTEGRRINPLPSRLTDGLPDLDEKAPGDVIQAYRLGKGRGIWLKYNAWTLTSAEAFSWAGLALYDYRMLWVGRAIHWAAQSPAAASVSFQVAPGADGTPSIEATIAGTGPHTLAVRGTIEIRRISDGWTHGVATYKAKISDTAPFQRRIQLPALRAGHYMIDTVARADKDVVAYGAANFQVKSPFGIESVEVSRPFVEVGETIEGTVHLRGTPPAGSVLQVQFRDSYDRVRVQEVTALTTGSPQAAFTYTPDAFATIWMRVQAMLVVDGREIEQGEASFTVPKRRRAKFNFLQWDSPRDVLGYYAWQQMRDAGMDLCLVGSFGESKFHPVLAAADVPLVPYSTRIQDPKDDDGFMQLRAPTVEPQPKCWNDEPAVDAYVANIVKNQQKRREHGVFCYSLGDEGVTKGCCVHPACMAAYQRYLEDQYKSITALNTSWESEYKSFSTVDLLDRKDNMEGAALKQGKYARWYDRQAFARVNLARFSKRFGDAYLDLDPKGVTGFEGTGNFGDDYDTIVGMNGFYGPYPNIGDDIVRSRSPRSKLRSNWMGYSKTGDALADAAWRMVMKGMDSIWYWMWTGVGSYRGYLTPTLDMCPAIADLTAEMKPVRDGLGDLLLNSEMSHSGIAVFYSLPSALAHGVEAAPSFTNPKQAHETWVDTIYELGLDIHYITDDMLRAGALTTDAFNVLILPTTMAIAPDQATLIRQFVAAGGHLIADVRPGVFDGHCKPLDTGSLDDIFGIRRKNRGNARKEPVQIRGELVGEKLSLDFPEARLDADTEIVNAEAVCHTGSTPVVLHNAFGKGKATLLNFQLLPGKPDSGQMEAVRTLVKRLLMIAGVSPPMRTTSPEGGPLPATEMRMWQNGDTRVFGLWRRMECAWFNPASGVDAGAPQPAHVALSEPAHVYDLREAKYLGKTAGVDTLLRWGRANFFLALPYRVGSLDLSLSAKQPTPGKTFDVAIKLDVPATTTAHHAVVIELTQPDGTPARWARQVVLLNRGYATVQLPIAINDAPGKWHLKATELFSHATDTATWKIR